MKDNLQTIKNEVIIDETGMSWFSQRAIARLCGVSHTAIQKQVETWQLNYREMMQDFDSGRKAVATYNDIDTTKLIEYYAFESKAKNATALATFRAFATIGLRVYFQNELGYTERMVRNKSKQVYHNNCAQIANIFAPVDNIPYIKCASIAKKAVALRFSLGKSVPKDAMTADMIEVYDRAHTMAVDLYKVYNVVDTDTKVKELVYKQFLPDMKLLS